MKFQVKPAVFFAGNNNYAASVQVSHKVDDVNLKVTVTDQTFGGKNGVSTVGVKLGAEKKGEFEIDYDVHNNAPSVILYTNANLGNSTYNIKYKHVVKGGSGVEVSNQIDKHNAVRIAYDLKGFVHPDIKDVSVKWTYKASDEWTIEPEIRFKKPEDVLLSVTHLYDRNNTIKASFDNGTKNGSVEWTQKRTEGDLKVKVTSLLTHDGIHHLPEVYAEKTWTVDL